MVVVVCMEKIVEDGVSSGGLGSIEEKNLKLDYLLASQYKYH